MSGSTIITPNTADTTLIQDGQTGTISAARMRQIVDSLCSLPVASIQTTSYTFVATDRGCLVEYNSTSAGTFTIPASVFNQYSVIGFRSINTGQLTIAAGASFTLNIPSFLTATPVQWATGFIHIRASNIGVMS